MKPADLHLHSSASDGIYAPREVVRRAHGAGLSAIALADHDTLAGIPEARAEAERLGLELLPACELSVSWSGRELHILAYGLEAPGAALARLLEGAALGRQARLRAMLDRLALRGVDLTEEAVRLQAPGSRSIGRQHLARALVAGGHAATREQAFQRFIGPGAPAHVPRETEPLERVLALVWEAGGVPVLAHPGGLASPAFRATASAWDLGGIEVFHPSHGERTESQLAAWAEERGWIATGGSDWHGTEQPGAGPGCRGVEVEVVARLRACRRA